MFGDETKVIAKVMLGQAESWKKETQVNWMKGKNPQEFEDNRKHVIIVWSKNERNNHRKIAVAGD